MLIRYLDYAPQVAAPLVCAPTAAIVGRAVAGPGLVPAVEARVVLLYNPGLRSAIFFVPGLVAYILAIAGVLLTALTIAREEEQGNLEQLFSTPVGRLEVVLGKLLP